MILLKGYVLNIAKSKRSNATAIVFTETYVAQFSAKNDHTNKIPTGKADYVAYEETTKSLSNKSHGK